MNTRTLIVIGAALALVLLLGGMAVLAPAPDAAAAPVAAPTPVSATDSGGNNKVITFWDSPTIVTGTNTSEWYEIKDFERIDLQYAIDQPASVNTVTLKLQFSNDGVNAIDGATIVSANAADAGVMAQHAVFGRYARIHAAATNANDVDVDVVGVAK